MRKVISSNLDTKRVQSVRTEASVDTPSKLFVVNKEPTARIQAFGAKKSVVRSRRDTDPPGLVPWIRISGEHYTADEAWEDSALKLTFQQ